MLFLVLSPFSLQAAAIEAEDRTLSFFLASTNVLRLRVFLVSGSPTLGLGLTLADSLSPVPLDFFKDRIVSCLTTGESKMSRWKNVLLNKNNQ